jgi:hypothetical protein
MLNAPPPGKALPPPGLYLLQAWPRAKCTCWAGAAAAATRARARWPRLGLTCWSLARSACGRAGRSFCPRRSRASGGCTGATRGRWAGRQWWRRHGKGSSSAGCRRGGRELADTPSTSAGSCAAGVLSVALPGCGGRFNEPQFAVAPGGALSEGQPAREPCLQGLLSKHIDLATGKAIGAEYSVGAEADSYFEYLLKYWILTGKQVQAGSRIATHVGCAAVRL